MKSASGNPSFAPDTGQGRTEILRWLGLLLVALWLAHPYFAPRLIGTGDALWYHHLLADAVLQFRAGEFPVYVGQSDFMFNGAVYPHRVAPYHQYLAGLLDLLTGRHLSFFALQHLTIILSFVGGAFAAYAVLVRIDPLHRGIAALLALLYVACPGVMGLAYAQDLYMSVMAIPWVPLALGGAWLTFREDSSRAYAIMVAGLAALWWSHPPIAMWVSLLIGLQQATLLTLAGWPWPRLRRGLIAAGALVLLVAYPFVSALLLRAPGESVVPYRMDRALLLKEINDAYPANLRPLDATASPLSQLQLGYGLWLALGGLLAVAAWRREAATRLALALAVFLLILVLPVPGLTWALWSAFPEQVVGLSLYWPMQRLLIIAAGLVVIGLQAGLRGTTPARTASSVLIGALVLGAGWSVWEARVFLRTATAQANANADSAKWALSENVTPMRHAYHLFSRQPDTMSHGVMDPALESRLLDPASGEPLPADPAGLHWSTFTGSLDANPGILNLEPPLVLEPGQRYRLTFDFPERDFTGVLQLIGQDFFREYTLPASGNPRAFGTGRTAARTLPLWTSGRTPLEVRLRFIPTQPHARAQDFTPFARYRLTVVDPGLDPIVLTSLIPYRARVRSPVPALLETPRMAVPGYTATVDAKPVPVQRTAAGFVAVPVPAGATAVEVRFTGPLALRATFWVSLASAMVLPLLLARRSAPVVRP